MDWRDKLALDAFQGFVVAVTFVFVFIVGQRQRDKELEICSCCKLRTAIFGDLCLQCKSDQIESRRASLEDPTP